MENHYSATTQANAPEQRGVLLLLAIFLTTCLLGTALGVIYSKHQSRQLFSKLQNLQQTRDELHIEWSQLLLEQGAWTTDARVERVAREHLKMVVPPPDKVIVFKENNEPNRDE